MNDKPLVGIVMGSDSDYEVMAEAGRILKRFGVPFEMTVASAHRTPERAGRFAREAASRGIRVLIAGAGAAAHLAGVIASETILPVIGVPIDSSPLNGLDALLATAQMPGGVSVATMAIGRAGARNAGVLAVQILAVGDSVLAEKLTEYKAGMVAEVEAKADVLAERLQKDDLV